MTDSKNTEIAIATLQIPATGRIKKTELRNLLSILDDEQMSKFAEHIKDLNQERVDAAAARAQKEAEAAARMAAVLEAVESAGVSPKAAANFLLKVKKPKPEQGEAEQA